MWKNTVFRCLSHEEVYLLRSDPDMRNLTHILLSDGPIVDIFELQLMLSIKRVI